MRIVKCILVLSVFLFSTSVFALPIVDGVSDEGEWLDYFTAVYQVDRSDVTTAASKVALSDDFLMDDSDMGFRAGLKRAENGFSVVMDCLTKPLKSFRIGVKQDIAVPSLSDEVIEVIDIDEGANPAAPVPEPATLLLLGSGLIGVAGLRKKLFK